MHRREKFVSHIGLDSKCSIVGACFSVRCVVFKLDHISLIYFI